MAGKDTERPRSRTIGVSVAKVSIVVAALWLAVAGPASAQTAFQANAKSTQQLPQGACTNGAYICGTAELAGYGSASWNLSPTSVGADYSPCGSTYTATTDLTLSSDPGSTLVLDEVGNLCGLGHDGAAYKAYFVQGPQAFGHPFAFVGTWAVDPASTGQFAGLAGSGTDRVDVAGAHFNGKYAGALAT